MKKFRYLNWLLVICWMGVIFYLSHQPAAASRSLSEGVLSNILHMLPHAQGNEIKLLHSCLGKMVNFIVFFILGIFLTKALFSPQMRGATEISRFVVVWLFVFYTL